MYQSEVTTAYRVNECDNVYDENGEFYCKWNMLSDEDKEIVKLNPASAR